MDGVPSGYAAPAGWVRVVRRHGLLASDSAFGKFNWETRTITLDAGLSRDAARYTFGHERCHQVLMDAGARPGVEADEERVCDALALAMVADMLNALR